MLGSRLRLAIQQDDLVAVRELVAAGAPVNDTWWQDSFPLQHAARLHGTAVLRALLDAGASVRLVDRYGRTALHDAAEHGGPEAVSVLLARGAPAHVKGSVDQPLHRAAAKEVVELLLDAGADIEAPGDFGATPLLRAAGHPNPAVAHTLLARGADPAATDDAGASALHEVVTAESAALLLEHLDEVDRPDASGYTPLCAAVQRGLPDVVDVLLAHGADPDQRLSFGGEPLLHLAASAGDPAMVRVLLAHGAHPECADRSGNIALHWAADAATGELLLKAGHPTDVHARNASGQTPLHRACDTALIALLLRAGADPRVEDVNGRTPADDADEVPGALACLVREGIQVTDAMLTDVVAGAAGDRAYRADVRALLDAGARPTAAATRIAAHRGDLWLRAALADAGVHTGSLLLDPDDQASVPQQALVVHPHLAEAITVAGDAVLVRWSLTEDPPRPIEAFVAGETRWDGRAVPRALAVSPDGSQLVAIGGDRLELRPWGDLADVTDVTMVPELPARLVTVEHSGTRIVVSAERAGPLVFDRAGTALADLGELAERFGPDVFAGAWPGGAVLVGDRVVSLSDDAGRLTLTGTDLGGDQPVLRYLHADDEVGFIKERMSCVGWLGCAPDDRSVAMWTHAQGRPGHGALVVVDPADGSLRWTRHLSEPGEPAFATACFSGDGQWLAVALGTRVHWLTVADGALGAIHSGPGSARALAWDHTANGLLVAGEAGLRRSPAVDHGSNA